MTSTVNIKAVNADVQVSVKHKLTGELIENFELLDGESAERHFYDDHEVSVSEKTK